MTIVHNLHPLIPRKELITVKTIRTTAGIDKIKIEISKSSRLRQTPPSNQQKTAMKALGNKKMQVRVKIYPASKRLYHGDNPEHKLSGCNRLEVFQKCLFPEETEIREKRGSQISSPGNGQL